MTTAKGGKIVDRNKNSRGGNLGSKTNLNGHSRKPFSTKYYTGPSDRVQCKNCRSDYMLYSVDGHCQRCLQRDEHLHRKRSASDISHVGPRTRGGQI